MSSEQASGPSDQDDEPPVDPDSVEVSEEVSADPDPPELLEEMPLVPSKTPFFQAIHALRYQRQAVIKLIETRLTHPIICYVSGNLCSIHRDDTIGFADLLHNIPVGSDLDLLLHTGGGDIDAARKADLTDP